MESNTWLQLIPIIISVFSLLISLLTLYLNRKDKKSKIKVTASQGSGWEDTQLYLMTFNISISNIGERMVRISRLHLIPENVPFSLIFAWEYDLFGKQPLPYNLESHETISWEGDIREFCKNLIREHFDLGSKFELLKVRVKVVDSLENEYVSKPIDINPIYWAQDNWKPMREQTKTQWKKIRQENSKKPKKNIRRKEK